MECDQLQWKQSHTAIDSDSLIFFNMFISLISEPLVLGTDLPSTNDHGGEEYWL